MGDKILNEIEKNIREINCYYNLDNKHKIDSSEISTLDKNLVKRGELDLSNLNYKIDSMEYKKKEKELIRGFSKEGDTKKKITSIITTNDIDQLDDYNKSWNKLDNWQKKIKITEYMEKFHLNDNDSLKNIINLLGLGKLKKKNKNIVYDQDSQLIVKINLDALLELHGSK